LLTKLVNNRTIDSKGYCWLN